MSNSHEMRRLLRLVENAVALDPKLEKYITSYPETVANDPQMLLNNIKKNAMETQSRYAWAIAELPDGRYVEMSPRTAQAFGLKIVQQGDSMDFFEG